MGERFPANHVEIPKGSMSGKEGSSVGHSHSQSLDEVIVSNVEGVRIRPKLDVATTEPRWHRSAIKKGSMKLDGLKNAHSLLAIQVDTLSRSKK